VSHTPIVFLIYKRPETTTRVFAEITRAKPPKLLVVADGPRPGVPGEAEKCAQTRAIIESVDWDCEVLMNYADTNMGLKNRVSNGLKWAFQHVEEAIILEDDCLPHPTFFRFCEELLERYRDDERIMAISGDNFQFGRQRTQYSYYFSRYPHCWGWATWRRAWRYYDGEMKLWPAIRDGGWLGDILENRHEVAYWTEVFDRTHRGAIDSWAYRWTFTCWIQSGLTILPNVNLVSNIGFDRDATHTKGTSRLASMPVQAMRFPLRHPPFVVRDRQADDYTSEKAYGIGTFRHRVARKISKVLPTRVLAYLRSC